LGILALGGYPERAVPVRNREKVKWGKYYLYSKKHIEYYEVLKIVLSV
jgi:hypothetical protein